MQCLFFYTIKGSLRGEADSLLRAGLLFGVLLTLDQRIIFFGLFIVLPLLLNKELRNARTIVLFFLSSASAPSLFLVILSINGATEAFIDQAVLYPLFLRNYGFEELNRLGVLWYFKILIFLIKHEAPTVALALISFLVMSKFEKRHAVRLVYFCGLFSGLAYILAGGRRYSNYGLILSPFIVCSISLLPFYLRTITRRRVWRAALGIIFGVVIASWGRPLAAAANGQRLYLSADDMVERSVSQYILDKSDPSETLLVWGYKPQIYLRTNRVSWFRDMSLISVAGANFYSTESASQGIHHGMLARFKAKLQESPPDFFVHYSKKKGRCKYLYCFGRGEAQLNMNFRDAEHLEFLARAIDNKYKLLKRFSSKIETAEIFALIQN